MKQLSKRRPDDAIAMVAKAQAKIDVIESDGEINIVKSSNFEEHLAPDGAARSSYSGKGVSDGQLT